MKINRVTHSIRIAVMAAIGLLMSLPLLYLLSSSLMTARDVSAYPPNILPPTLNFQNYVDAWGYLTPQTFLNSIIFSFGVVICQAVVGLVAGFALAKVPFRGATVVLAIFIIPMFLPNNVSIIPIYLIVNSLGLVNTYAGMIIPVVGSTAFATLLFRQTFASLPNEIIEAARIDGATWSRILVSIGLPLVLPGVAAYASITFVGTWNQYIWPLIVAPSPDLRVLPVALAPLAQSMYQTIPPNVGMAAAVISTVPILIIFLATQKWYVRGIVGTGAD